MLNQNLALISDSFLLAVIVAGWGAWLWFCIRHHED